MVVDPYGSDPCGVRYRVTQDGENPNLIIVDAILPEGFVLAPGQSTSADAIRFGMHFNSATKTGWNKSNDPSFVGVAMTDYLQKLSFTSSAI